MNVSLDKNIFRLEFSSNINLLKRRDICNIFKIKYDNVIFVDAWLFLNSIKRFNEYLKINKLLTELHIEDNAKQFLSNIKKSYINNINFGDMFSELEICNRLKEIGFKRALKTSQLKNVKFLLKNNVGADFSVPGAGKSTTAFALYSIRKSVDLQLKMLIICPKNVFGAWEDENKFCFQEPLKICRLDSGNDNIELQLTKEFDVFLITYEQLLFIGNCIEEFLINNKSSLYIDECHRIKRGFKGKIGRKILNLSYLPKYKNVMSGTPMPNKLSDLVSLYEFLYPLENVSEKNIVDKIQDVYVRTTKKDMNLEPYSIIKTIINPDEEFINLYNLCIGRELEALKNKIVSIEIIRNIRKYVIKMIQLSSNPKLLLRTTPELLLVKEFTDRVEKVPPKINIAVKRAYELAGKGKKIIIWTNFIDNIKYLEHLLKDLKPISIFGGTPIGSMENPLTREGKLKRFKENKNDYFVMIANPQAVCEGISLQNVCDYAIFIDRNYDSRLFEQAINRIHRLGLLKETRVTIEILMLNNSIDINIDKSLDTKLDAMYKVLNDSNIYVEWENKVNEKDNVKKFGIESGMSDDDIKELYHSLL